MPIRFPVVGQRVRRSVFPAAFLAFERRPPLSRLPIRQMGVLMQVQIVEIREAIRTDVTAVRQLIAVAAYMGDKFRGEFEEAAAAGNNGAAVALLAQVGAQVGAVQGVFAEPLRAEPTVVEALEGQRAILAKEHTIVQFGGLRNREAVIGLQRMV